MKGESHDWKQQSDYWDKVLIEEEKKRKGKKKVKLVKVGKRGSIIIPADMVAEMKIGKADKFTVRRSKSGISMKKES